MSPNSSAWPGTSKGLKSSLKRKPDASPLHVQPTPLIMKKKTLKPSSLKMTTPNTTEEKSIIHALKIQERATSNPNTNKTSEQTQTNQESIPKSSHETNERLSPSFPKTIVAVKREPCLVNSPMSTDFRKVSKELLNQPYSTYHYQQSETHQQKKKNLHYVKVPSNEEK